MKKTKRVISLVTASALVIAAGGMIVTAKNNSKIIEELGLDASIKGATDITASANAAWYDVLDFNDRSERENATKGLIDAPKKLELKDKDGNVIWSQKAFNFVKADKKSPDSINPSLWENTINNHAYGLFEVRDGIYQVRGYDMANFTVVATDSGWVVFDTTMCKEIAEASLALIEKNLGKRPIKAVVISHSHVDHFGGIEGVVSAEELADPSLSIEKQIESGKIPLIVAEGFEDEAVSENLFAGNAMSRRANYQYGVYLTPGETGRAAMGIGMGQSAGTTTFLSPTYEIKKTGEKITVDGLEMEFHLTPGTEAPAEMNTWIPSMNALWVAENCTGTLHNLYTLRGAQIRDGNAWVSYITDAVARYGKDVEVSFQSHNWPHWGNDIVNDYLVNTAAVYKFINDQTLSYINQGYTPDEISNMISLPAELAGNWYTRGYYGTVSHDSQAVYEKYMGWYDANPVNLNPLAPSESAKKWVEYLGDVDKALEMAKADYDKGDYRWVAELTNTIIFADPGNTAAKYLCADALEQLGYQAESGTWRNSYLMAAKELREGNQAKLHDSLKKSGEISQNLTPKNVFDYLGIIIDKNVIADKDIKINFVLDNSNEKWMIHLIHGAVLHYENYNDKDADLKVNIPDKDLVLLTGGSLEDFKKAATKIKGDESILKLIFDNRTQGGSADFNIIEP